MGQSLVSGARMGRPSRSRPRTRQTSETCSKAQSEALALAPRTPAAESRSAPDLHMHAAQVCTEVRCASHAALGASSAND